MPLARVAAKAAGRSLLPMVELPYAMVAMSDQEVMELADKSFEDIVNALTKRDERVTV